MNVGCIGVEWTTSWRIREHNWCWCSKEVVSVGWTCTTIRIGSSTHCYHHPSMLQTFKKIRNSVQLQPSTKYTTKFLNLVTPSICLTLNMPFFRPSNSLLLWTHPGGFTHPVDLRWFQHTSTQDGRGGLSIHILWMYYDVLWCIMMYNTKIYIYIIIYIICDYVSIYIYNNIYIFVYIYWLLRVSNCSELHFDTVWPSLTWNLCVLCCCMFVSLLQCYLHNNSIFI